MATINYTVGDNWGSGFVGNITVPGGTSGLHGWTLEFDATFDISNIWGAEIVTHVGNHYVIRNAAWTADVAAGGQASFGFEAKPGSGGTTASGFTLNGTADTPTPPPVVVPTISIDDASITEGDSGTSQLTFTVKLSQAASGPVTVNYSTANGTATAGSDYSALTGTITFAAGETTKTITIPVTGDTTVEANETFTVNLASPSGATIADGSATGTIVNNDVAPPPPPATGGLSLDYDIVSNWGSGFTAAMAVGAGSAALNGWTVAFDASFNITSIWNATIVSHVGNHYVVKNADWNGNVAGGKETSFGFQATPGSGGTAASGFTINGTAVGTDPVPVPTLSVADATVAEGNSGTHELAFTVTLSAAATGPVTVAYATSNGTATAGSDYTALSGTLTFAAGETSKVVRVQVSGDTAVEANETVTLTLSSPNGATIADGTAVGTITNDDTPPTPTLAVADATVTEGNSGTRNLAFTVSLSAAATGPVTVAYATSNGTATAGSDYTAASGTLTFAAGETSKVVNVQVSGDTAVEANETLTLTLSSPSGATIADGTAIGTITNDDTAPLPTLSVADATVSEGNSGAKDLAFTVTLSAAATGPVTVAYATSNGTATAGSDYTASQRHLDLRRRRDLQSGARAGERRHGGRGQRDPDAHAVGAERRHHRRRHGHRHHHQRRHRAPADDQHLRRLGGRGQSRRGRRRRTGLVQHLGQPDRRFGRPFGADRRRELVRLRILEPLRAARPVDARLQGHDGPDEGSRASTPSACPSPTSMLHSTAARPTASTSPRTPTCRASPACRSWTRSSPMPARSA